MASWGCRLGATSVACGGRGGAAYTRVVVEPALAPLDVPLPDGRRLVVHEAGAMSADARLTVIWHHGSPQSGALYEPLIGEAERRGIRMVSFGRPSYGGSTPNPGRDAASVGRDVIALADALGLTAFVVMGASGGGPHALACAAAMPDRVRAVATFASVAPFSNRFDWFAGMQSPSALRAATEGREARARFAETDEFDPRQFVARDWAVLSSAWQGLGRDAEAEGTAGHDGLIDDDVALVTPWGFDLAAVAQPVLLVHGGADKVIPLSHARWLLGMLPNAELWERPRDGHVSVLEALPVVLDWLVEAAGATRP
jgi:pimeloyl-ACP methyl ester carboxylesterase